MKPSRCVTTTAAALCAVGAASLATTTAHAQSMGDVQKVAQERGLSVSDLMAAAKTYMPSGKKDDYIIFSSGGHSGQVFVIGVPSMRLLRSIAVFTPEPWRHPIRFSPGKETRPRPAKGAASHVMSWSYLPAP